MNQPQRATRARYVVIAFMVTLAMVTYLDRACIGAMKQHIAGDFGLDDAQMGWVFTSFILAYAIFEIPTARWADRHGAGAVLTRIVSWWSVFTLMTAGAFNYVSLLVTRFLFGAGEAGAFPCVARVLSRWVPLRERGTAKGIFFAGAYASAALTTFTVNALLPFMSWRTILVAFGCVGFVWVFAWRRWFRDEPTDHPAANEAERALIIADRAPVVAQPARIRVLGRAAEAAQCAAAVPLVHAELRHVLFLHHLAAQLPARASRLREHPARHAGRAAARAGDWHAVPRRLLVRQDRAFVTGCAPAGGRPAYSATAWPHCSSIAATLTPDPKTAAVLFALTVATCMLTTAASWSTCVDIGREHSATVSATMNTSGQIAAIVMPPVVGYSLKWFGNWNVPFYLLAGLYVMGALCWMFIDPKKAVFEGEEARGLAPAAA